ncbi:hypothetical protein LCGC14_1793200, partial [marine sediment metagenome]
TVNSADLTTSFANQTLNVAGWNVDRSASEMDGAQVRVQSRTTGMPHTPDIQFDCGDVDVVYTLGAVNITLTAETGVYALAGPDTNTEWGHLIDAALGTYALTGIDVTLNKGFLLTAELGTYDLIGPTTNLIRTHVLIAALGTYFLVGPDTNTEWGHLLTAALGTYALTGIDVNLRRGFFISANTGVYVLTGTVTNLVRAHILIAALGVYVLAGPATNLEWGHLLIASLGTYSLVGTATILTRAVNLIANTGIFVLSGIGTDLIDEDFDPDPGWAQVGDSVVIDGEVVSTIVNSGSDNLRETFPSQDAIWSESEIIVDELTIGTSGHRMEVFLIDNGAFAVIAFAIVNDGGVLKWESIHGTDAGSVLAVINSVPFSIGTKYKLKMHNVIATTTSSNNGICELWIGKIKVLDIQNADNNSRKSIAVNTGNVFSTPSSVNGIMRSDNVKVGTFGLPPVGIDLLWNHAMIIALGVYSLVGIDVILTSSGAFIEDAGQLAPLERIEIDSLTISNSGDDSTIERGF